MPNPYSYGPMVTDPKMFFGREEELRTLYTRLRTMQSISIVGLRRIGKSSLLYRLVQTVRDELGQNYLPLYIDLQDARYRTVVGFVTAVAGALNERMGGLLDVGGVTDMAGFTRLVERLRDNGVCPVLCLDEFEELVQHPEEFGDDFLEGLRALGSHGKLALVTASRIPLADLIQKQGLTSPFFNIFSQIELGLLEPKAARALRRVPFEREGVILTPEEEALVEELAGRHPFYLQIACHHLYEVQPEPANRRADLVRERFNQDAKPHFQQLWEHLDNEAKAALKMVVGEAVYTNQSEPVLQRLACLGLVERVDGKWRVFSNAFAAQVRRYPTPRRSKVRPSIRRSRTILRRPWLSERSGGLPPISSGHRIILFAGVAIIAVLVATAVSLVLPGQRLRPMLIIASLILVFALIGGGYLTGRDFLRWLAQLLGLGGG